MRRCGYRWCGGFVVAQAMRPSGGAQPVGAQPLEARALGIAPGQNQPAVRAMRTASTRLRASSFAVAAVR